MALETTKYIYVKVQDAELGKQYTLKVNRNDAKRLRLRKIKAVIQKAMKSISQTSLHSETEKSENINNKEKLHTKKRKYNFDLFCGDIQFTNEKMCLWEIMQQCHVHQEPQRTTSDTDKAFLEKSTFASLHHTKNEESNDKRKLEEEREQLEECVLTIHRHTASEQRQCNNSSNKTIANHEKHKIKENLELIINKELEKCKHERDNKSNELTQGQHRPPLAPPSPINGGTPRERMTRTSSPSLVALHQSNRDVMEKEQQQSVEENHTNYLHCKSDTTTREKTEEVHHLTSSSSSSLIEQQHLLNLNNKPHEEFYCADAESNASLTVSVSSRSESEVDEEFENENRRTNIDILNDETNIKSTHEEEPAHIIYTSVPLSKIAQQKSLISNNSNNNYSNHHTTENYVETNKGTMNIIVDNSKNIYNVVETNINNLHELQSTIETETMKENNNLQQVEKCKDSLIVTSDEEIVTESNDLSELNTTSMSPCITTFDCNNRKKSSVDDDNSCMENTTSHTNNTNNVTEYIEHLEKQVKELQEKLKVLQCNTSFSEANVIH